jgi:hypothetical protein
MNAHIRWAALLLAALFLATPGRAAPEPPLCRVIAEWTYATWSAPDDLVAFGTITVQLAPGCAGGYALVRLGNYGGRQSGAVFQIVPGKATVFGPVPQTRSLEWLARSGLAYRVPLRGQP